MEQFCTNFNENLNSEEIQNKKRFHKAINLIDDFVTKFISKIEYYKMTLESQINNAKLTLINTPLSSDIKTNEKKEDNETVKDGKININENKSKEKEKEKDNIKNNDEFLNKFMNTKNFYKKALYLLYLITEDKSQIQKIIEKDEDSCLEKKMKQIFLV